MSAEEDLEFMKTYSEFDARGCVLCTYEDGVFLKACGLHEVIDRIRKQRDAFKGITLSTSKLVDKDHPNPDWGELACESAELAESARAVLKRHGCSLNG